MATKVGSIKYVATIDSTQFIAQSKALDAMAGRTARNLGGNLNPAIAGTAKSTKGLKGRMAGLTTGLVSVGSKAGLVGLAVAGVGAATYAAIKPFVSYDDQLTDVAKTTGATRQQVETLGDKFLKMSTKTRTTASELANIATIGGQLGVATKDILGFTRSINKINVALGDEFNGNVELVTNAVGGLRNVFVNFKTKNLQKDLLNIGNALNELGASGRATAPVVTDFASRIGGLTIPLGNTAGDVLGLSAVLQELNVNVERGGSAVGRIFSQMTKNIGAFANIAGQSIGQFKKLVNQDINKAFIQVLKGINKLNPSATDLTAILDKLGINSVGAVEVINKLSGNTDLLQSKQKLANRALKGTNSILDEYSKKNNNAAAKVEKFKNGIKRLVVIVGRWLFDAIAWTVDAIQKLGSGIKSTFAKIKPQLQPVINVLKTVGGWIKGFAGWIASQFKKAWKDFSTAWKETRKTLEPYIPLFKKIGKWIGIALLVPLGLVVVIILVVVAVAALLLTGLARLIGWIAKLGNNIRKYAIRYFNKMKVAAERIRRAVLRFAKSVASAAVRLYNSIRSKVGAAIRFMRGLPGRVVRAVGNLGRTLFNAGKSLIQGLINGIKNMASGVANAVKGALGRAREYLPFSPAKRGPFSGKGWTLYSGRSIMKAFAKGIEDSSSQAINSVRRVMRAVSTASPSFGIDQFSMAAIKSGRISFDNLPDSSSSSRQQTINVTNNNYSVYDQKKALSDIGWMLR